MVKLLAIYGFRLTNHLLRVFPIKKNKIVFVCHQGRMYTCNPKYISDYLQNTYPDEYDIVWVFANPEKFSQQTENCGVRVVRYNSPAMLYEMATAEVCVVNCNPVFAGYPLRKGQLHINTWHGGGCYKKMALNEQKTGFAKRRRLLLNAKETSYMLSTSRFFSEYVLPEDFGYHGNVLNIGFPRNDFLVNGLTDEIRIKVRSFFEIPDESDFLLYAPTWRYEKNEEIVLPDFKAVKLAWKKRFGKDCCVMVRAHRNMTRKLDAAEFYDATDYPEMQELLAACDMLISDYSSCIWDYSFTGKPCMLFTPDLDKYQAERGFDVDIHEWGFPVCIASDDLCHAIENYDESDFRAAMRKHHDVLGSYETGSACEQLAAFIRGFHG